MSSTIRTTFPFAIGVLSVLWVLLFVRLYLTHSAHQFATDFSRQNYSELAVSDVFALTTRINALSGSVPWSCVEIRRGDRVFYSRKEGNCRRGLWSEPVQIQGEGQDSISVDFTFTLHHDLLRGVVVFTILQLMVLCFLYHATRSAERERNAGMVNLGQLAAQVAHDIRSPLMALNTVSHSVHGMDAEIRSLLSEAIGRIRSISESLLVEYRHVSYSGPVKRPGGRAVQMDSFEVSALLSQLLEEKKFEFMGREGVNWAFRSDVVVQLRLPRLAFLRVMSNLLSNAAESIDDKGSVAIEIKKRSKSVSIEVTDTGKGIPPEVIKKLGKQSVTYGKIKGNGLGLSYVFDQASQWGVTN